MFEYLCLFGVLVASGVLIALLFLTPTTKNNQQSVYTRKRKWCEKENVDTDDNDEMSDENNEDTSEPPPKPTNVRFLPKYFQRFAEPERKFDDLVRDYELTSESKLVIICPNTENSQSWLDNSNKGLTIKDACSVVDTLRNVQDDQQVNIIVHNVNTVESMDALEMVVRAVSNFSGAQLNVHIPFYAGRYGTLIALAADDIYLGKNACMPTVSTQVGYVNSSTVLAYTDPSLFSRGSWVGELASILRVSVTRETDRCKSLVAEVLKKRGYEKTLQLLTAVMDVKRDGALPNEILKEFQGFHNTVSTAVVEVLNAYQDPHNNRFTDY